MGSKSADRVQIAAGPVARACARRGPNSAGGAAHRSETRSPGHFSGLISWESSICLRGREGTQLDAPAMLQDACHYLVGKGQRTPACRAVDNRRASRSNRLQKRPQFSTKGLFLLGRKGRKIELGLRARFGNSYAERILACEIDGNIFVLLKKTHFAHPLGGNPAGRDVGDRAGFEIQARVGDVDFIGQDGNSDGLDVHHWRIHQREQNIQVMNHNIIYHINIETPWSEHAETVDLKIKRAIEHGHHRHNGGIESLQMPHLQDPPRAGSRGEQIIGFRQRSGHGLFDQDIDAEFKQPASDTRMLYGGHGHTRCVHTPGERFDIRKNLRGEFGGNLRGASEVRVHDADQFRVRELAIHPRVIPPEVTGTDHGHSYFLTLLSSGGHKFPCFAGRSAPPMASSGNASIAIPAASADSITRARSNSSVRPASIPRAVTRQRCITSTVLRPTTGTSNLMSCRGLLTFTTTREAPSTMRAARSMVSSVPSMASTATQARSRITTVWPRSSPAI